MPTTVKLRPFRRISRPIACGAAAKIRRQASWLSTATGAGSPTRSSSGVSARPSDGSTPSSPK
jgi:hypothetical protein